jgi:hypothetical protein
METERINCMACDNNVNSITRMIMIVTGRNANEDATNDECFKPVTNSVCLKKIVTILVRTT